MTLAFEHVPVLCAEVIEGFGSLPRQGVLVDCTLGLGGYSEALLRSFEELRVIGVDQDAQALALATERLSGFGERFLPLKGNFRDLVSLLREEGFEGVNGLVADLGVSNLQITEGQRGFSFRHDGPLDMRMNQSQSLTAAKIVNSYDEKTLADLLWRYGEERLSRRIAAAIVRERKRRPFETTFELAEVVAGCYPAASRKNAHPARRTFQALRIEVNDEMGALEALLEAVPQVLCLGGVAQIVSYHSLEDRAVKGAFRADEEKGLGASEPRKGITPSTEEVERNPKSRSARLRRWVRKNLEDKKGRPGVCRR